MKTYNNTSNIIENFSIILIKSCDDDKWSFALDQSNMLWGLIKSQLQIHAFFFSFLKSANTHIKKNEKKLGKKKVSVCVHLHHNTLEADCEQNYLMQDIWQQKAIPQLMSGTNLYTG